MRIKVFEIIHVILDLCAEIFHDILFTKLTEGNKQLFSLEVDKCV